MDTDLKNLEDYSNLCTKDIGNFIIPEYYFEVNVQSALSLELGKVFSIDTGLKDLEDYSNLCRTIYF